MKDRILVHTDLEVYRRSFDTAMHVFDLSRQFPSEERFSLTDQIRRSSRSVCANLAEAWRKRRYAAAFISKLSDAERKVAETQVWLEFAVRCAYMRRDDALSLHREYDCSLRTIVGMINHPDTWLIGRK